MKKYIKKIFKSSIFILAENVIFLFFQLVSIPIDFALTIFYKVTILKPDNFKIPKGTLIIANHQSKVDPFLMIYNLGFSNLWRTLPFRVPVTHYYMKKKVTGKLIYLIGGFDIGYDPIEKMKKLLFIKSLLRKKRLVLIFPEARLIKSASVDFSDFKKGVFFLLEEINTPILFVKTEGFNSLNLKEGVTVNERKIKYSEVIISDNIALKIQKMEDFFTK